MPPNGLASISYIRRPEAVPGFEASKQTHEERRVSFAMSAVDQIFDWLAYSPNNPRYLTSETYRLPKEWLEAHTESLVHEIENGTEAISEKNEIIDLYRIEIIRDGVVVHSNRHTGTVEPLAKMFVAQDFLEAGIKPALEQSRNSKPEDGVEAINERAVRAIGAMVVRGFYFDSLHERHPEAFTAQERDSHLATFRQNIVATVFYTARLEQAALQQATEQSSVQPGVEPKSVTA
ncbi:MAG TPA: hypothetical protein PKD68_01515 [Candidatus Saccharibacteria bacterium]|nr:hypothetical protein [Candidatus Saccharibacteria bacterium]